MIEHICQFSYLGLEATLADVLEEQKTRNQCEMQVRFRGNDEAYACLAGQREIKTYL